MSNDGKVKYGYDEFDRLTKVCYDNANIDTNPRFTYEYGTNGGVVQVTDHNSGKIASTEYDLANRPMQMTIRNEDGDVEYRTTLKYDDQSRLSRFSENVGAVQYNTTYTYDKDSRVTEVGFGADNRKVTYTYDDVGRISQRTVTNLDNTYTSDYTFVAGSSAYGSTATSGLVSKITQPGISFEYTYDNRGNILSEKRGSLTTTYVYDGIGQLTRVNDPHENATWIYEYDRGGNILSKSKYAYTTGTVGTAVETIPYGYTDTNWKDKLTSYNNVGIEYDAIGNPTNDGTWTYTWEQGRKLKRMEKSGTTVEFEYDHNGLRTRKVVTVNGVTTATEYKLHGKLITDLIQGSNSLHFYYDSASTPAMVDFNGTIYTYVKNLQGDIVGIMNNAGTLVAEYKYDAWGKPLSVTGTMASTLGTLNPFRYRGYVWDQAVEFYYLRSRYYCVTRGCFINADVIINNNAFSYCSNSVPNYIDSDGMDEERVVIRLYGFTGEGPNQYGYETGHFMIEYNGFFYSWMGDDLVHVHESEYILNGEYASTKGYTEYYMIEFSVSKADADNMYRSMNMHFLCNPDEGKIVEQCEIGVYRSYTSGRERIFYKPENYNCLVFCAYFLSKAGIDLSAHYDIKNPNGTPYKYMFVRTFAEANDLCPIVIDHRITDLDH